MTPDFSTPVELNRIGGNQHLEMIANESEREAIASRLGLLDLPALRSEMTLSRSGQDVEAKGHLVAHVVQSCVITNEPVESEVRQAFAIHFRPEPDPAAEPEEIELEAEDCDIVFHDGQTIALGEAIADTLALALDPYPRSQGAEAAMKEAGILDESQAGPFAALARLKSGGGESAP